MRTLAVILILLSASQTHAATDALLLQPRQVDALGKLTLGNHVDIDAVPDGSGHTVAMRFERIDVYAPGARIVRVDGNGEHEILRSARIHLIGSDSSGDVRTSLDFDAGFANVSGVGRSGSGAFVIGAVRHGNTVELRARPAADTLPAGVIPEVLPNDDALPSGAPSPDALAITLAGGVPAGSLRTAVVAIDTDNEFMSERFSNNTAAASNWIGDLFAAMNVMYRRDLSVSLQQGTTMLRTTSDPYSLSTGAANQADLTQFGNYWQANYGNVSRSFAAILSGAMSSGNSASGIAWINAYCQTQSQGGSYSVDKVFTNPQIDVSYAALIVGHEIGHNFGAYHTHCTNVANGSAPTATNTIDQCFNGEAGSGCYNGVTSCPSSGPGHPAGTIMSYCNLRQCGPDGQNVLQFHPTQISVLNALIASNTPSCLGNGGGDDIFADGFE